ncbi:putative RNA-directed DNA polymerase from transposon X-element [Exaiptasia diaphana]|nr:putative RNA-directed DNA polymerase from transposon X-element [Exaiptasia diaphana]
MIRKSNSFRNGGHKTIKTREWKLFNEANFLADLEKKNWVCHGENPNAQWEGWKANLMDTIDKHAPIRNKRVRAKKSPWIDYDLVRKMRKRDLLKRQHAMTNDPDLWLEYKKSRNDVNNCIKIAKRKYYTENLEANVQDQRKTWKLLNELQNRQSVKGSISELKMGDATLKDPTSIAEAFNSHFTNVGPNLAQSISHTDIDPLSYLKPVSSSFSFHEVTNKDVLLLLQNLNSKKATGPDKIPAKLLKLAGNIISPSLTKIFNCSLSSGIFPEDWKVARVSPVYKAGTKSDPNNYRPISVVPIVAKIFEKLVHNQLYRYLATNNLLANNQSGFRSLHSTLTALIDANNSWCVNIDKGLINGVVFIDLKKAFDTIDHKILIQKLKVYGIDRNTLPWFESYLLNRQQHCSINGHISKDRNLSVGVPQGTLLGPLLFLIYINDLPNSIGLGHSRMYADDTSISFAAQTKHELQTLINRELSNVNIWLKSNKLSLNVAKTEFMTIGSRQRLMTQANAPIDIHIESISDHSLVFMIRKSNSFRNGGHKTIKTREWKLFNEANFLADLEKKNWVCHGENPNAQWEGWKANLMDTIDKHAPIRNKRVRAKKSPWIDYDLVRKMRKRDLLKRQHAMTNDPDLWLEYKKSRNDVNNCIKIAKRKYYTENLEANVQDQRKTWKLLNELQNRQSVKGSISELKMGDATLKDPTSIAEAFNSHFTNVGPNLAQSISHTDIDPLSYLKPVSSSFSFHEVTNKDVLLLLQNLNSKKATGPDKIPAKLLKLAGNIISPSLTKIFNCSLSSGIFPEDWKVARVSPVYKAGTKSDPNNYRPISVVPIVAKIFEKLVHNQLYRYLATNNLLANNQSGFRSLHSTLTALIDANNSWCVNIDKGLINGVVFIDLKKAFDTIDHKILIQKLKVYGIDRNTLPWFESYLLNRQQHCSINGHISKDRNLSVGVPQGTLLGPLLFLIYINDLPNSIGLGHSRMYADDTSISFAAQTKHELQTLINRELSNVNIWLKSNKLSLNVAKTEFMTIGSRQRLMTQANAPIDIHIESSKIKQVSKTKSIGVIIDETLSWAEHVNYISKKISSAIGALKRVRCFIDQATAAKIYKAIIEPHFNYCSPVFDGISQKLDDKLQKLQNRAARIVTRSSFDESAKPLLDMLGWDTVSVAREKQKAITMFKSVNSLAPKYLMDMFSYRQSLYNFRNSENILNVPKPRTNYLKRSLGYSGAVLWNGLTCDMRTARSLADFKKQLNGFFL